MKIVIYKTVACAYCPTVMKYLDMKGIKYETVDVTENTKLRQEVVDKSGVMTVPITVRGDWEAFVIGPNYGELAKLIKE